MGKQGLSGTNLRTCRRGHQYYKTSDCPVCPICENLRKPLDGMLSTLSAPARRALEKAGITTPKHLANYSAAELLALHGVGPSSIPKLQKVLNSNGLSFKRK